jgi:hypothetical protein
VVQAEELTIPADGRFEQRELTGNARFRNQL